MEEQKQPTKWDHILGWVTIRDETGFRAFADEYRKMLEEKHAGVEWHPVMPGSYPVLLQPILFFHEHKPFSITVILTVDDAVRFLNKLGLTVTRPTGANQDAFNHAMSANVLSLVEILISKGLVSEKDYTRKLQANSATVDQWKKQDTETRSNITKAIEGAGPVLDGFYPTKSDE